MIKKFILSGLLLTLLTTTQQAQSKVVYVFDFDNTLVENREQYKGTFNPKVELYRIDGRQSLLQNPIKSEKTVTVLWSDFHERLKPYLAPNAEEPGMLGKRITLSDGRVIEAGHYYLRFVDSYYSFNEGDGKSNFLLETYHAAKKAKGSKDAWKGKTWPLFQYLHSSQAGHLDADVLILTLRGHSPEEWNSFFKEVKKVLSALKKTHTLGLFTEGYHDHQFRKIKKSGLLDFFSQGHHYILFNKRTLKVINSLPKNSVIIDDNPEVIEVLLKRKDITPIWINRKDQSNHPQVFTIHSLEELLLLV
jgi:FMN phosphatase YigB (HAD superfamily)